mmetsp:Transcript_42499/g.79230  ORF Transcript_42499/g.79230 Transcript_42499/m.79230 type:complete len:176 (+) Transcript_42499:1-528(+)
MQVKKGCRNPMNSYYRWKSWDWHDKDALFEKLQTHLAEKHIMTCIFHDGEKAAEAKAAGLHTSHYYSFLAALSEQLDDGTPVKLVKLRNPWGYKEWTKDWSDSSDKWDENPKLKARVDSHVRNDGQFWMAWDDWEHVFSNITICPCGSVPQVEDEDDDEGGEGEDIAEGPDAQEI